jgi:hypothetical protein
MNWAPSTKAIKITNVTMDRELATAPVLSIVSRDGVLEPAPRGKSAIKRAAIDPG